MAIQKLFFRTFAIMQDLENNNWIIIDPLGNIDDIHDNRNVMTTLSIFNVF